MTDAPAILSKHNELDRTAPPVKATRPIIERDQPKSTASISCIVASLMGKWGTFALERAKGLLRILNSMIDVGIQMGVARKDAVEMDITGGSAPVEGVWGSAFGKRAGISPLGAAELMGISEKHRG